MFGYTEAEMIGQPILKIIPEDRQEEEPRIIARLRSGERVDHFETKRITSEKKLIDVSLTISPVRDTQGHIIGISKIARDISERKQNERRKDDFIGMVSHELKTPLTSLTAIIQVAEAKLKDNPDSFLTGAMAKAGRQIKKMVSLVNGFLDISRLESGKMLIEKQDFNLSDLLKEIITENELNPSTHIIQLGICDQMWVHADRDKIGSVVANFLSNAIKYSPRGKHIEVECQLAGKFVQVSVKDEGMGIKAQDLPRVFDRYYRVETNHTRNISGFGIGLYLCAEIIKHHGGKIWVESESGVGSTFYFSLPLARQS
jgi:PAS domain S-box-containing protein